MQEIPVPLALKHLILSNNNLLKSYQRQLMQEITAANEEMMEMLGITDAAWTLDMEKMIYVKFDEVPVTIKK